MLDETKFLSIKSEVEAAGAQLVAVTKQRPVAVIERMYALGHRDFGENRVSELTDKYEQLPKDIRWHFIGHLQRNKVKYIAPFIHLIHSGDSARLLREVNKQATRVERTIPILLQYHIAAEASKYGLDPDDPTSIFKDLTPGDLANLDVIGVMGMATYTDDDRRVTAEFTKLKDSFTQLRSDQFSGAEIFRELSMGMSGDYPLALAAGSTLVRVGSLLYK